MNEAQEIIAWAKGRSKATAQTDESSQRDSIRQAAAALGRMGGKAGRGEAKRRSVEHYRAIGRKSGESRRLKQDAKTTA